MFKSPFSFVGRIRRIEFFLSGVINFIIVYVVLLVFGITTVIAGILAGNLAGLGMGLIIFFFLSVGSLWFFLAQGTKRLHDLNKSGWLMLLTFVPVLNLVFVLYLLFADGTVGPNEYGLDPKKRDQYLQQPPTINVTVNVSKEKEEVRVEQDFDAAYAPKAEVPADKVKE